VTQKIGLKVVGKGCMYINTFTPNDTYSGRTAPLTSKVAFHIFIQQKLILNILNVVYTLRFFSSNCSLFHNSNVLVPVLFIFYIQGVLEFLKNSIAKRLRTG